MVDRLRDVAIDLGCESELLFVREIAQGKDAAEQQRAILQATQDRSADRSATDREGTAQSTQVVS